jgi:hypothetical protein
MIFLSKDELAALTGRKRPTAQARALAGMGIPYRRRPDGSPVVLRIHLDTFGGTDALANSGARLAEPVLQP